MTLKKELPPIGIEPESGGAMTRQSSWTAPKARIDDPFYSQLMLMYRRRATIWNVVSGVLLLSTIVFVVVGIYLFYTGDAKTQQQTADEVRLKIDLEKTRAKIAQLSGESEILGHNVQITRDASILSDIIKRLPEAIESALKNGEIKDIDAVIRVSKRVLDAVATLNSEQNSESTEILIPIAEFNSNHSGRFPKEALELLLAAAGSSRIEWKELREATRKLAELNLPLESDAAKNIARDLKAQLSSIGNIDQIIDQKLTDAEDAYSKHLNEYPQRRLTLSMLEQAEKDGTAELEKLLANRNYVLFMAWVPDLTLRVGAVILLLFLTRVLLATYRYTVSLSTFYTGIADSIQLLQPGGNGTWYQIDHLQTLLVNLVPMNLKIEPIATPTDQIADLAKAWIAKRP